MYGGFHAKFQVSRTNRKKSMQLFPKAQTIFWEILKNKVCPIKMFAKQKSYLIIEKKKFRGVRCTAKKLEAF